MQDKTFNEISSAIEALLFVHGDPMSTDLISDLLDEDPIYIEEVMKRIEKDYEDEKRGITLFKIDNKYQLGTKGENEPYIVKLLKTNQRQSLSQAAIETLSIISYKQPVTRIEIEEIRGVRSDKAIQTLLDKELIRESGRLEVVGRPIVYSTTENFLKQFGIEKLEELPTLEDIEVDG